MGLIGTRSPCTDPELVSFRPALQASKQAAAKRSREASGSARQPRQEAAVSARQQRREAAGSARQQPQQEATGLVRQPPLNRAACAGTGVGSPVAGPDSATCVGTGIHPWRCVLRSSWIIGSCLVFNWVCVHATNCCHRTTTRVMRCRECE